MEDQAKWDKRFLGLAKHISSWSKDPGTQTGSVIVDQKGRVVSVGYNGLAQGVQDLPERLKQRLSLMRLVLSCRCCMISISTEQEVPRWLTYSNH